MSNYFVKFVPYNERTLEHLINKTVKFSTVFEFNDFNEYHYIPTSSFVGPAIHDDKDTIHDDKDIRILVSALKAKFNTSLIEQNLVQLAKEAGVCGVDQIIKEFLASGRNFLSLFDDEDDEKEQTAQFIKSLYEKYLSVSEKSKSTRNSIMVI